MGLNPPSPTNCSSSLLDFLSAMSRCLCATTSLQSMLMATCRRTSILGSQCNSFTWCFYYKTGSSRCSTSEVPICVTPTYFLSLSHSYLGSSMQELRCTLFGWWFASLSWCLKIHSNPALISKVGSEIKHSRFSLQFTVSASLSLCWAQRLLSMRLGRFSRLWARSKTPVVDYNSTKQQLYFTCSFSFLKSQTSFASAWRTSSMHLRPLKYADSLMFLQSGCFSWRFVTSVSRRGLQFSCDDTKCLLMSPKTETQFSLICLMKTKALTRVTSQNLCTTSCLMNPSEKTSSFPICTEPMSWSSRWRLTQQNLTLLCDSSF